jgi:uncharacterized Zn finger protein
MLLKTKDGVACDLCGTISKENFTYYSFEGTPVLVDAATCVVSQQSKDLDIDVCEKCYSEAEQVVRKNIAPAIARGTVKCDLCTKVMSGKFQYHIVLIHKVHVDKDQADAPPKVEMRFMDFNLDDNCFISMANAALATRQKMKAQGDWS